MDHSKPNPQDNATSSGSQLAPSSASPASQGDPNVLAMESLLQAVVHIGLQARAANEQNEITKQILENLSQQVYNLSINPPQPSVASAPTTLRNPPKFCEPWVFTGKTTDVEAFVSEICNTVYLLRAQLFTNRNHLIYMGTYLGDGSPKSWYNAICEDFTLSHTFMWSLCGVSGSLSGV
jgi:hypothetical protein